MNAWRARAAVLALAYVVLARGVGNLYPFSGFEMYGATRLSTASRIAVVTADGVAEVERFSRWRCDGPIAIDPRQCVAQWPYFHVEARDLEVLAFVEHAEDPGDDARPATLIRRVWRLGDVAQVDDCVIATCEAAP